MVQLAPVPFDALIGRMFRELETKRSVFDLPAQRFVDAHPGRDFSVAFRERRASTPFGPAAGPHTQMAQNIALSWLAGGRVIECKTVQVNDAIEVPRPCIDMANRRLQRRMVAGADRRAVARGIRQGRDADRDAEGVRRRRRASRHDVRHERRLRSRRNQVGQGQRVPRRHAGRGPGRRPAADADSRTLAQVPRPAVSDPHLRHADALDLPRLPAGRDRGDRRAPRSARSASTSSSSSIRPCSAATRSTPSCTARWATTTSRSPNGSSTEDAQWPEVVDMVERLAPFAAARGPQPRREVLQYAGGREQPGLLSGERTGDVSVRPAAASAGDRARRALPQRLRRPPAGLVLRRDRRAAISPTRSASA